MASGEGPAILAWLRSGGAASRAFREWNGKCASDTQADLRQKDRQLLFDVQKELENLQKALSGEVNEVRAAFHLAYSWHILVLDEGCSNPRKIQ